MALGAFTCAALAGDGHERIVATPDNLSRTGWPALHGSGAARRQGEPGVYEAASASASSCRAGRLSMKELTENTARPGPGGP